MNLSRGICQDTQFRCRNPTFREPCVHELRLSAYEYNSAHVSVFDSYPRLRSVRIQLQRGCSQVFVHSPRYPCFPNTGIFHPKNTQSNHQTTYQENQTPQYPIKSRLVDRIRRTIHVPGTSEQRRRQKNISGLFKASPVAVCSPAHKNDHRHRNLSTKHRISLFFNL